MKPAVVTSAYTMGLGVIRALGERGVPVVAVTYDGEDMGHVSRYVVEAVRAPRPDLTQDGFVEVIDALGPRFAGSSLVPASDASLVAISSHKDALAKHFVVACPDRETVQTFVDKRRTYALAAEIGVDAPQTITVGTLDEAIAAAEVIGLPCLVKPAHGHVFTSRFGAKMYQVDDVESLEVVFNQAADAGLAVMIQEIVPGPDANGVNYNTYLMDGRAAAQFTSRKLRNAPPRYGSPRVAVSEDIPAIAAPALRLLNAVNYHGFANVEFKWDQRSQAYRLMEVNARHNLSSLLAVRCGVDFPWLEYNHLVNEVAPARLTAPPEPTMYWIDLTRDMASTVRYAATERLSLRDYLRPYLSRKVFAVWKSNDPRPFLLRLVLLTRRGVRRLTALLRRRD